MVFLRCICSVGWIFSQPHLEILHISGLRNCGETQTEDVKIYNPRTMTSRASNVMRITETRNSMTWNRSMSRLFSALGKALRHLGKALVKKNGRFVNRWDVSEFYTFFLWSAKFYCSNSNFSHIYSLMISLLFVFVCFMRLYKAFVSFKLMENVISGEFN